MQRLNVIGFNHHNLPLQNLGELHIPYEEAEHQLFQLKEELDIAELSYLSTCNRVEFYVVTARDIDHAFIQKFLEHILQQKKADTQLFQSKAQIWNGINAVNHIIEVACSIDSMVLGEREIISQMKEAFKYSAKKNLSGDLMRLVEKQAIKTAKEVYTSTFIAKKSVSVVGLAYKELVAAGLKPNHKILVVGAGTTNRTLCKLAKEFGVKDFSIYNRTPKRGQELAQEIGGDYFPLEELGNHKRKWDVLFTCTSADEAVVTKEIYEKIGGDASKLIVDIAIPNDVENEVIERINPVYISVQELKKKSKENLTERKKELLKVRQIIFDSIEEFKELVKRREIELKLNFIPNEIKNIRQKALEEVFQKELEELDDTSKEVLEKVLNYMEKKYVSIPMKMAKELLSEKEK